MARCWLSSIVITSVRVNRTVTNITASVNLYLSASHHLKLLVFPKLDAVFSLPDCTSMCDSWECPDWFRCIEFQAFDLLLRDTCSFIWFNEDNSGPKVYELALEIIQCCPHWIIIYCLAVLLTIMKPCRPTLQSNLEPLAAGALPDSHGLTDMAAFLCS
jgi:hypothetical protein